MQTPALTMRIEMFGNLVEELGYWGQCCENEDDGVELEYCEQMFLDTLNAVREFREILLEELDEYRRNCEINHVPVDISYYRIQRQLQDSTFALIGGT